MASDLDIFSRDSRGLRHKARVIHGHLAQPLRFLVAGGLATMLNWIVRFPLSLFLPFTAAVALAYAIGMVVGFLLYRGWVFKQSKIVLRDQLWRFLAINSIGLGLVSLGSSIALSTLDTTALLPADWCPAVAHAAALTVGASVNYICHKSITFASQQPHEGFSANNLG